MSASQTVWTAAMLEALPDDGNRYEVIDGELFMTPAPTMPHQRAQAQLLFRLGAYCIEERLDILAAPTAVRFSGSTEVQPDIVVIPRMANGSYATKFEDVGTVVLAIEILSPSTARRDRTKKRALYQRERVGEYWIVDLDARCIERWRPESVRAELNFQSIDWQPISDHTSLTLDVAEFFRAVFGV